MQTALQYLHGFGNQHASEAVKGALPIGQNSPQVAPFGLYPEQINGTAFTEPRHQNLRSWVYKILPSAAQGPFAPAKHDPFLSQEHQAQDNPNRLRWGCIPKAHKKDTDFIHGVNKLLINGSAKDKKGVAIYLYAANASMQNNYFYCADGDWLIVPYLGKLILLTEFGKLCIQPGEFAVIPRGIKFSVQLMDKDVRGYICENYGQPFMLPELGAIGCNGLANARDFMYPTAYFEQDVKEARLLCKYQQQLWQAHLDHSPLNVVAWHGNLLPYKYDLTQFNSLNSVSYDHPDPSIFTVLTSPTPSKGLANIDFVVFPERWMVAEHTFRPPYFHRNTMSEYMGLIYGNYDAKGKGFVPGGSSCHNCMSAHGPDVESFLRASTKTLKPEKQSNVLAFMFESIYAFKPTEYAIKHALLDKDYDACWQGFKAAKLDMQDHG